MRVSPYQPRRGSRTTEDSPPHSHPRNIPVDSRTRPRRSCRPRARAIGLGALAVVILALVTSESASAAPQVVALADSVTTVLNNIRNWLVGLLASLATVYLTVGGVRYLAADGDPGEVGKAKQAFKSAAWGFGLAALAPLVVEILKGIVGVE